MNWRVSPWWKSQGEPGEKQTLGGDTRDRQGAVLLAELIRRRPEGTLGSPVSACPSWLPHRQPSSSRQPSTSSPWSRKRLDYCSRTPSSSGSSRYCPRDGTGGVGQSWLTRAGKSLQFLGFGVGPSTLLSQRVEMFPFPWQGREPHSTWHLLPGRGSGVGVPFSSISTHLGCQGWPGSSSGGGVPWLNCPVCHSVRIRLAQGCGDEDQGGGHRQEPIKHNPRETLSCMEQQWKVALSGCQDGRESIHSPLSLTPHSHGRNSVAPPRNGDGQRTKTRGSARRTSGKMRRPRICVGR